MPTIPSPQQTLMDRCFAAHYPAIAAYFGRRCPTINDAEDAATEVFAIAWRRLDAMPPEPETRLWLFGVARRVLADQRRSFNRRERLRGRLETTHAPPRDGPDVCTDTVRALTIRAAMAALSDSDRDLLALEAWDGLTPGEIARVLGIPAATVSVRLYRARRRLGRHLAAAESTTDSTKGAPACLTS